MEAGITRVGNCAVLVFWKEEIVRKLDYEMVGQSGVEI